MPKIAVLDDSRFVRSAVCMALDLKGYQTLELDPQSLFQVVEQLKAESPDLLILDLLMPAFSGISLVRFLRKDESLGDLKVIVASAHLDEEAEQQLTRLGVLGFLRKPCPMESLVTLVDRALGKAER